MKHLFTLLTLAGLSVTASAQNWQPFREGRSYHFLQSGAVDSLFNFKVSPGPLIVGDSAWEFNPMAMPLPPPTQSVGCGAATFRIRPDNQFGHWLVKRPGGVYEFATDSVGSFRLQTQAAVGQSWNFGAGVQATLLSKSIMPISLVQSDSVQLIRLSTSDTLVLSKHYGFLQTSGFMALASPNYPSRKLRLYAIPEQGLGTDPITFRTVFDFQPGDKFQYHFEYHYPMISPPFTPPVEGWFQDSIISRVNHTPDSIEYTVQQRMYQQNIGGGNSLLITKQTISNWTASDFSETNLLSQGFRVHPQSTDANAAYVIHQSVYNQRYRIDTDAVTANCPGYLGLYIDSNGGTSYAKGLGYVYQWGDIMGEPQFIEMTAYVKGNETYGTWLNLGTLATADNLPSSPIYLFPNPTQDAFTLQLPAGLSTDSKVQLTDLLGRVIWNGQALQNQTVSLADQPTGIYLLTVTQAGNIWHSKVLKE